VIFCASVGILNILMAIHLFDNYSRIHCQDKSERHYHVGKNNYTHGKLHSVCLISFPENHNKPQKMKASIFIKWKKKNGLKRIHSTASLWDYFALFLTATIQSHSEASVKFVLSFSNSCLLLYLFSY